MRLTKKEADKIKVYEDTEVAHIDGKTIYADNLKKWAYRRLETWLDMLEVCKELVSFCESKERLNADDVCPTKAYELAKTFISKV